MPNPYSKGSAAYEAREQSVVHLAYWSERALMTDAEFLAEYCAHRREEAASEAKNITKHMADEDRLMEIVRRTGTDEG